MKKAKNVPITLSCESGQGLTEYLMIMILVAVVSIVAVQSLGKTIQDKIQKTRTHIEGIKFEN